MGAKMVDTQFQFHMEEFRALQDERSAVLSRGWNLIQYNFIFSFAFYGWILSIGKDDAGNAFTELQWNLVVWIPFLTNVASFIFSYGFYNRIVQISKYIRKIEELLAFEKLGWQRYMNEQNIKFLANIIGKPTSPTTIYIGLSWIFLIGVTFLAGMIFSR